MAQPRAGWQPSSFSIARLRLRKLTLRSPWRRPRRSWKQQARQAGQDLRSAKDALAEIPADCATALQKLGNALIKLGSAKGKLQEVASRMPQGLTVAQVAALSNALTSGIGAADAGIAEVQTKLDECTGGRAQGRAEECCDDTGIDAIIQRVEDGSGHVADALALLASIVPTVSEWGLIVMALVVLTAGTVVLGRRRRATAA